MNITLVYFIYGLALFSLGLAMTLESNRTPVLADRRTLRPLTIFGLLHGGHVWMEMFVNRGDCLGIINSDFIAWIRVIVLAFSFAALLNFAWLSFLPREAISRRSTLAVSVILGLYVLAIFFVGYFTGQPHNDILPQLDVLFRLLLAVPGAIVAATAIFFQSKRELKRNRLGLANALRLAAIGFFCYGLTQIFVPAADFFPARIINKSSFMGWTGVPIQFSVQSWQFGSRYLCCEPSNGSNWNGRRNFKLCNKREWMQQSSFVWSWWNEK